MQNADLTKKVEYYPTKHQEQIEAVNSNLNGKVENCKSEKNIKSFEYIYKNVKKI